MGYCRPLIHESLAEDLKQVQQAVYNLTRRYINSIEASRIYVKMKREGKSFHDAVSEILRELF